MVEDVIDGLLLFFFHVGNFAELDVVGTFFRIVDRVQVAAENVLRAVVVSEPKLQAHDGAQRDEGVEDLVIANGPGHAAEYDDQERGCGVGEPRRGFVMRAIREPSEKEGKQRAESSVGH